ncbi:MAG: phage holin family protein [Elusimicrobia bacterium]|nr:phage holin family protein [Elusimicrobiota bacterium]
MRLHINLLISTLAVLTGAYLLPGVSVQNLGTAVIVAIVLGILNTVIKPLLVLVTLPITLLTLGLFLFVINALMILLVDFLVPGFHVQNFWWALLYSLAVTIVASFLHALA